MLLELQNLSYAYPDPTLVRKHNGIRQWAIENISFKINPGEKIALLGANGSGKSTLLLQLNGILKASKGTLIFNKQKINYSNTELCLLRENVAVVFQDPDSQLFAGTLYEDVSFGPNNLGLSTNEIHKRVYSALSAVDLVSEQDLPLHMLSYGQKKRAALAGALAMNPQILVLDEPTAGMDPRAEEHILKILNMLVEQGMTVLFSTHDVDIAYKFANRIMILCDGKLVADSTPKILMNAKFMQQCALRTPYCITPMLNNPNKSLCNENIQKRLLVITGEGKGKTTAAMGILLRNIGHNKKSAVCQFIKHNQKSGELIALQNHPLVRIKQYGHGFLPKENTAAFNKHIHIAKQGWRWTLTALKSPLYQTVILDEICIALHKGLLPLHEVLNAIRDYGHNKIVVCTGRYAPQELMNMADTVSIIECNKHGYAQGMESQIGVEK